MNNDYQKNNSQDLSDIKHIELKYFKIMDIHKEEVNGVKLYYGFACKVIKASINITS